MKMVGSFSRLLRVPQLRIRRRGDLQQQPDSSSINQKQRSEKTSTISSISCYPIKSFASVLIVLVVVLRANSFIQANYSIDDNTTVKKSIIRPEDDSPSLRGVLHSVDRRLPRTVAISSQNMNMSMSEPTSLTDTPYTKDFQIDSVSSTNSSLITPEWFQPNSLELIRGYDLDVCKPKHDWQSKSFPNCNMFHETSMSEMKLINSGTIRLVLEMSENIDGHFSRFVFKTLMKYDSELGLTPRWIDRERKDALVSERATGSRFIPSIHGYCSHALIMEHAPRDMRSYNARRGAKHIPVSSLDRLKIGIHIASGVADLHSIDFTHNDLHEKQFLYKDGVFKLNDFNYARAMYDNTTTSETCTLTLSKLKEHQLRRSLEELQYRVGYEGFTPSTPDKNDVWIMGDLLYRLLTDTQVWKGDEDVKMKLVKRIVAGKRPQIPKEIEKSNDPAHVAMLNALDMTWTYNWKERPSARAIADYLIGELRNITGEESPDIRINFLNDRSR